MTSSLKSALIRVPFALAFLGTALLASRLGAPLAGSLESMVVMPSVFLGLGVVFALASEEMVDEMKNGNWTSFRA